MPMRPTNRCDLLREKCKAISWAREYACMGWTIERAENAMLNYGCPPRIVRWCEDEMLKQGCRWE